MKNLGALAPVVGAISCPVSVAPGEGNKPLSIFRDQYSEELAYPGIFLGQKQPENKDRLVSVHYSDICKSELR